MKDERRDAARGPRWKPKLSTDTARELRRRSTRSEEALWNLLRNRQLDGVKFRRQHRIGGCVVDFCCLEARLVLEIDGPIHRGTREADQERQQLIEDEGYRLIRILAEAVEADLDSVLQDIRLHLARAAP